MSDSRRYHDNDDVDDKDEDVESYRSRRREEDRASHRDIDSSSNNKKGKPFQSDRAERMRRLRQEMQQEDEDLAALDQVVEEEPNKKPQESIIEVKPEDLEGLDEEEQMKKLLGFGGFGSTKGESVEDNQSSAARGVATKNKARKYRQYMNRKNGFNRPLEKMG
jgi:U4/U6.U5 tri-snRNP-associated protein 3